MSKAVMRPVEDGEDVSSRGAGVECWADEVEETVEAEALDSRSHITLSCGIIDPKLKHINGHV